MFDELSGIRPDVVAKNKNVMSGLNLIVALIEQNNLFLFNCLLYSINHVNRSLFLNVLSCSNFDCDCSWEVVAVPILLYDTHGL